MDDLKGIARRCAAAFWVGIVLAAIIWWQTDVRWAALIPAAFGIFFGGASVAARLAIRKSQEGTNPSGLDPAARDQMNRQIARWAAAINQYGVLMEEHAMTVLPETALPLPKADMKAAFRFAWFANPETRGNVEAAYIHLAQFQPGIGAPIHLGMTYDPSATPMEAVQQGLDWRERTKAIRPIVTAEEGALLAELAAMKAGPPPFAEHLN